MMWRRCFKTWKVDVNLKPRQPCNYNLQSLPVSQGFYPVFTDGWVKCDALPYA